MPATNPKLLVATTTWWPSVAILASSLQQAGFDVVVLCPRGHAAHVAARYRTIDFNLWRNTAALEDAIRSVSPVLVVPGDDRTVAQLRQMYGSAEPDVRALIERSIGAAASHDALTARVPLLQAAAEVGLPVPDFAPIATRQALERWIADVPPPWVLKIDGAWGGEGVRIADTPDAARRAFRHLAGGPSLGMAHKRRWINGDPLLLEERRSRRRPVVSAQAFVHGCPGNCALFALEGHVLGATMVMAESTCAGQGPATLVRIIDRPALMAGARRLVKRFGLSGFIGLDFMLDQNSDDAWLIEMNPRITGPSRMRGPFGVDPIGAAAEAFGCSGGAFSEPLRSLFASFPLAWLADPYAPELASCRGDVPWHEPRLLEETLKPLWPERGPIASLPARLRSWIGTLKKRPYPVDYRLKPLSWWIAEGILEAPHAPQRIKENLLEHGTGARPDTRLNRPAMDAS